MEVRGRRAPGLRRAPVGRAGLVLAIFLLAGLVGTWPALKQADSHFLAEGLEGLDGAAAPGDHLQVVWQLWLPGHQLAQGAEPWLDPYSFRPEAEPRVNFAGWPFAAVFGPLEAAFGPVVGWNLFVLLGYLGAGVLTFLWLRSLGLSWGAALLGGLVFALAPYRALQAGAGHLLAWTSLLIPFAFWAWERRWFWLAATAITSIPLSGQVHLALGVIPLFAAYALARGGSRRWAAGSAGGAVVAGLVVWALSVRGSIGSSRSFEQVERYSAELADFMARDPRGGLESFVFVGWLVPLLAIAGVVVARSRLAALLGLAALIPMLLALGGNLPGYEAAWESLPALGSTRVSGRFMPIACLAFAGLAALAANRIRPPWLLAAVVALVAVDLRADVEAFHATQADPANGAYATLRAQPGGRVLELPVEAPDRQEASVYLYYGMQTPREHPSGYSSVAPREAARTLRELRPCADARQLTELGVRYLVVHGRPRCGVGGRLLARDGPIALYEAYLPVAW